MSTDTHDFDAIAADDALIDAIIAGSAPEGDEFTDALVALHAYVSHEDDAAPEAPAVAHHTTTPGRFAAVRRPSRAIAVVCATGVILAGGVGAAVAGDPSAPLRYIVHKGVLVGQNFGSPDSSGQHRLHVDVERPAQQSPPLKDGSSPTDLGSADKRSASDRHDAPHRSHSKKGDSHSPANDEPNADKPRAPVHKGRQHASANTAPVPEPTDPSTAPSAAPGSSGVGDSESTVPPTTPPTSSSDEAPTTGSTSPTESPSAQDSEPSASPDATTGTVDNHADHVHLAPHHRWRPHEKGSSVAPRQASQDEAATRSPAS